MPSKRPRLLLFDDNIRSIGGHFLELATLLMQGASELGYETKLAAHGSFRGLDAVESNLDVQPAFHARRMVHWSIGVDGHSHVERNLSGKNVGGTRLQNTLQSLRDPLVRFDRRPKTLLRTWAEDFTRLLSQWDVNSSDTILINTADDFVLLALAGALSRHLIAPLNIHAIFHFAIFDTKTSEDRKRQFGNQVNRSLAALAPHRIHLHATTTSLSRQLAEVGVDASPVPYPTRYRSPTARPQSGDDKKKIVLAGTPRAEKGRRVIPAMLSAIHDPHLVSGNYRMSMQMPAKRWKRMIPRALREQYEAARQLHSQNESLFEIKSSDMPSTEYHRWLDTADVGLFLYESERYVARCSGVLLEMFIRGIPVIVPDRCWLADQVRAAGGDGSVGYIFQNIEQLPELLHQLHRDYEHVRWQSINHAMAIAKRHRGTNTLVQMGIRPAGIQSGRMAS